MVLHSLGLSPVFVPTPLFVVHGVGYHEVYKGGVLFVQYLKHYSISW